VAPSSPRTIATLDLVGGAPVLDLVNTVDARPAWSHDHLASYDDVVAWAVRAGVVDAGEARALRAAAERAPDAAGAAFGRALALRELAHRVLSAAAAGDEPTAADLGALAAADAEALAHARLERRPDGTYAEAWAPGDDLDGPRWPLAHGAVRLLVDGPLDRLEACPGCGWLFLDTSRNRSRRWCSMDTCGARDKMQRYYRRRRAGAGGA
jgi:predicted RNA-binding Zn ribbon-like protein